MDLIIDTSATKFQVSGEFEPRLDKDACAASGQEWWYEPAPVGREARGLD